jgi:hypothetical protein
VSFEPRQAPKSSIGSPSSPATLASQASFIMYIYYVPPAPSVEPRSSTTVLIIKLRSHINPTFAIQLLGFYRAVGWSIFTTLLLPSEQP